MSKTHNTIPTVSPSERALLVTVNEVSFASVGGIIPPINTLYNDAAFRTFFGKDYLKEFSNFRYVEQRANVDGGGTLLFVKSKTSQERDTPFITYAKVEPHEWSSVLKWIKFEQETNFPLSQNYIGGTQQGLVTVPRWLVQYAFIQGMRLNTYIKVREFLSDLPYSQWSVLSDEPQPTAVTWDLIGSHGNTGPCLHREENVPGQGDASGVRVVLTDGSIQGGTNVQRGQKFYRTNHLTWQDYVVNTVVRVDGQYHRTEETFIAPPEPRASIIES